MRAQPFLPAGFNPSSIPHIPGAYGGGLPQAGGGGPGLAAPFGAPGASNGLGGNIMRMMPPNGPSPIGGGPSPIGGGPGPIAGGGNPIMRMQPPPPPSGIAPPPAGGGGVPPGYGVMPLPNGQTANVPFSAFDQSGGRQGGQPSSLAMEMLRRFTP